MLALLPVQGRQPGPSQPGFDGRPQRGLPVEPSCEGDVGELRPEAFAKCTQGAQLVELEEPVLAVSGAASVRHHEPGSFEVAEHSRRPARLGCCLSYGEALHRANLTTSVSGSWDRASVRAQTCPRGRSGPRGGR